jgi:uncharacterized protein (DUF1778 family)
MEESERRSVSITIRVTNDEMMCIQAAALERGITVTELLTQPWTTNGDEVTYDGRRTTNKKKER